MSLNWDGAGSWIPCCCPVTLISIRQLVWANNKETIKVLDSLLKGPVIWNVCLCHHIIMLFRHQYYGLWIYRSHTWHNNCNGKISVRLCTHERHPTARPNGRDMGCLSRVQWKLTAIYRERTVICCCRSQGGIYLLNLVDYAVSGFPLLVIGFMECAALNWIYSTSINWYLWRPGSNPGYARRKQVIPVDSKAPLVARLVGPTWGPSGADRTQVGPMLAPMNFAIWDFSVPVHNLD